MTTNQNKKLEIETIIQDPLQQHQTTQLLNKTEPRTASKNISKASAFYENALKLIFTNNYIVQGYHIATLG